MAFFFPCKALKNLISLKSVLRIQIRIRWIRTILASWIRIQGAKYQTKTEKKMFHSQNEPKSELLKKDPHQN